MKVAKKKKQTVVLTKVTAGDESFAFRGEFSGTHAEMSDKEWVKYMNKKHGFKWNGKD